MTTLGPTVDISHELISTRRMEGTPVYGMSGERLGDVHSVMLDKHSGHAAYVVISTTWYLGATSRVVPIAWHLLEYVPDRNGYVIALSRSDLDDVPNMGLDDSDRPVQQHAVRH